MEMQAQTDFFSEVHKVLDPDNLSAFEKFHLPIISAPDTVKAEQPFEVTVEAGTELGHPNENMHFIEFIELYVGHVYLARMDYTAVTTLPILKATVVLNKNLGPLRAFLRCNIHGVWETSKPIKVQ
jgi:superoxide reductase